MATATDAPHWFWRGVQSAIFYYVSLTPCIEYKYKRKRRHEAREAEKQAQIVSTQPGTIRQPTAFQTNEQWAEEMILGPGPPKAWKKDNLLERVQKKLANEAKNGNGKDVAMRVLPPGPQAILSENNLNDRPTTSTSDSRPSSSDTGVPTSPVDEKPQIRPKMERRLSTAVENIKDSFRLSLHPDKWNWIRYDREDEMLAGFSEKVTRIWNRATTGAHDADEPGPSGRRRAATNESDRYDWGRGRLPAVNDLHPSIVSQLPATREEAAWMLLPPPSAAVMAGKTRPTDETGMRRPLCVIGRHLEEDWRRGRKEEEDATAAAAASAEEDEDEDEEEHHDEQTDQEGYFDEGTAGHIRHRSDPSPKIPRAVLSTDHASKPRSDTWHLRYVSV